ncbi:protein adenylyltransferase SelO, mitochondrial-like [Oppia nitens]|uniref:protein adenylyltransferase SelO, mitochondrial-like n=1 Tax=Oppia nitens TaxID=1686743 RepID=UPI0023DCD55D|nr:protein adenylyltransferase SelO, mitochondrial-like [Oppia nitens]
MLISIKACNQLIVHSLHLFGRRRVHLVRQMANTLDGLVFDNKALRCLPLDPIEDNYVRTVDNSCFSRVKPTPLANPRLVSHSLSALNLIDIDEEEVRRQDFVQYFCGNELLNGSETASHCYCGHQFGVFAGQLGDGAAIYLGEIINNSGQRWELQLKGAGLTPYSREADGRKVLRSSVREFLCSEAMHYLGVPTTRAATCIISDDKVVRDMFYTGEAKHENCSIISRLAPTFIRFGSFEIFKTIDPMTGRRGPSVGRKDILLILTKYTIETFFPEIDSLKDLSDVEKYKLFYKEVVVKTAELVAFWQTLGFCHGVLNTDNMSILGLTLDYGPFGFMDRFDWDHVPNTSDDGGRYSYAKQPEICKWNLFKFAEALQPIVSLNDLQEILENTYYDVFNREYTEKMLKKFGLFKSLDKTSGDLLCDVELFKSFLDTMEKTGADFTNCFRSLSLINVCHLKDGQQIVEDLKTALLSECCSLEEIINANEAIFDTNEFQLFLALLQTNPQLLEMLGKGPKAIERVLSKIEKTKELKSMTSEQKLSEDTEIWEKWIDNYVKRLEFEIKEFMNDSQQLIEFNLRRVQMMNENNPKYILRNYLAQEAIDSAENGDFGAVNQLLKVLENPFKDCDNCENKDYSRRPPNWANKLKVSCSS